MELLFLLVRYLIFLIYRYASLIQLKSVWNDFVFREWILKRNTTTNNLLVGRVVERTTQSWLSVEGPQHQFRRLPGEPLPKETGSTWMLSPTIMTANEGSPEQYWSIIITRCIKWFATFPLQGKGFLGKNGDILLISLREAEGLLFFGYLSSVEKEIILAF